MPIVECPACRDEVTTPESAPASAIVRCPLCQDEFELAEVLEKMPPALIVVSGAEGGFTSSESDAALASDTAPSFDFAEQAAPAAPSSKSTTSSSKRTSRRPRRQPKNPIWEVVKVAGGGVIGLSMGQLILWWAFHRDPAQFAPKIPASMQWVLPSALRTGGAIDDSASSGGSGNVGSFSMGELDDFPTGTAGGNTAGGSTAGGNTAGDQGTGFPQPEPNVPYITDQTNSNPVSTDNGSDNAKGNRPANRAAQATQSRPHVVIVRDSPNFAPRDLSQALSDAQDALDAWRDAKSTGKDANAASRKLYADFAQLAHTVTFVDPGVPLNRQLAEKAEKMAASLPEDAAKMFGAATDSWIRKRTNDGVALFGTVTRVEKQGELFESVVKLTDRSQRRISVISGVDPKSKFRVGDRVLILGEIIEQPEERVAGYEGIAPMVVLGGLPIKFTAPSATKAAVPKTSEPKSTAPKTTEPKTTEPKTTEPKTTKPKASEPKASEPKSTEPKSTEPKSTEPKSTEPKSTEPKSTEPKSTEPKTTKPKATEPKSTEPKSTEPKPTEPKSTEPKPTEPKTTEPAATVEKPDSSGDSSS